MTDSHISTHDAAPDDRNDNILIYVDGEIVHRDKALVSVYDSGFMLGDGVWEGLRLYDGHIPFLSDHLDRLFEAALYIALDIGLSREALTEAIHVGVAIRGGAALVHAVQMLEQLDQRGMA